MPIQSKSEVITALQTRFDLTLSAVEGKKVFFETAIPGGRRVVVCSPQSKTHKNGQGWIDLTRTQIELMDEYDIAILALRLPHLQTYFLDFQRLRPLLADHCVFLNDREGEHWKTYVWPTQLEIRRNATKLPIVPNSFEQIAPLLA